MEARRHDTTGMSVAEKVAYYTDDSAGPDACWPWTGSCQPSGYGQVYVNNSNCYGHVLSFEVHKGRIPTGMIVRHTCDNPPCVNPSHLVLGTKADNSRDMVRRGRSTRGERHPDAKLAANDVVAIRMRYAAGGIRQKDLAAEYGVTRSNIDAIVNYRSWKHVV